MSVIVENSDDNQWSAFKYGLKAWQQRTEGRNVYGNWGGAHPEEEKAMGAGSGAARATVIGRPVPGTDPAEALLEGKFKGKFSYAEVGELPKE